MRRALTAVSSGHPFPDAEAWLQNHLQLLQIGERSIAPKTRAEFLLADQEGLLAINPQWLPSATGLRLLGLPSHFGRRQMPFGERWQERFLTSLVTDPEFAIAVQKALNL